MKLIANMKIMTKLLTGFILVAALAGFVGFFGIQNMLMLDKNDTAMYEENIIGLASVGNIQQYFFMIRLDARGILTKNDKESMLDEIKDSKGQIENFNKAATEYEKTITVDEDRVNFNELKDNFGKYISIVDELEKSVTEGKTNQEIIAVLSKYREKGDIVTKIIDKIQTFNEKQAKERSDSNTVSANRAVLIMIILVIIGAVLSIFIGIVIAIGISRPVKGIAEAAEKMANGDMNLNIEVKSRDEVGMLSESFNKMIEINGGVFAEIKRVAEQVNQASLQVAQGSQMLAQASTEQSSTIEEISSTVEEIASQSKENAANARSANELAGEAREDSDAGATKMRTMMTAMEGINEASASISKIIKVIDDIAFQTNILALNAAVEAARAGSHGKGFAVVAEEVRNLAARSAQAASETTELIESTIKKVNNGTNIASQTAEALAKINDKIGKVTHMIQGIATSSGEQATAVTQVSIGIGQISNVIQTNSSTAEESAAASEELLAQANVLRESVSRFKLKERYDTHDRDTKVIKTAKRNMGDIENFGKY